MKIRPMAAQLFHADRRTDGQTDRQTNMTKLTVARRKFANAPEEQTATFRTVTMCFSLIFLWRFDPITVHGLSLMGLRDYT